MTTPAATYTRKNPFPAKVLENRRLNLPGSSKDTRHQVLSLEGSGISYHVGDALGVLAQNPPEIVAELLQTLSLSGQEKVKNLTGEESTLRHELQEAYQLNQVNKKFVQAVANQLTEGNQKQELEAILAVPEKLEAYLLGRDYIDVLKEFPGVAFSAEELVGLLVKSNPRLYSIASSLKRFPGEVHLTVAVVSYLTHGRRKQGFASGFLGNQAKVGDTVPVYIQPTRHFHLPAAERDLIMVGPGTGIAPFRAFLQERAMEKTCGKHWLFFGDQHRATDFLYEEEFLGYQRQGLLTRLDTAFSRDQAEKIYVQDRMREHASLLWKWLQEGAYFYVCGDASRMAKDVHQTLIDIAQSEGKMNPEAAAEYVNVTLAKTEKRYLKDVY